MTSAVSIWWECTRTWWEDGEERTRTVYREHHLASYARRDAAVELGCSEQAIRVRQVEAPPAPEPETPPEPPAEVRGLKCDACQVVRREMLLRCPDGVRRCIRCYDAHLKEEEDDIRSLADVVGLLEARATEIDADDAIGAGWLRLGAEAIRCAGGRGVGSDRDFSAYP